MDELAKRIAKKVTDKHFHLTMVRNSDGFLSRSDVQQALLQECGVLLLPVCSALELRVRYELSDRISEQIVCYIANCDLTLLPDMKSYIKDKGTVNLSDIMPAYDVLEIKKASMSWSMASYMCKQKYIYNLSPMQTISMISSAEGMYGDTVEDMKNDLKHIMLDWDNPQTIEDISRVILRAISKDCYGEIEAVISQINDDFQTWLNVHHEALPTSSHIKKPKIVNKILPYIAFHHGRQEKVALIVIDGMTYWQYLILNKKLLADGLQPINDMTIAWIPTITKLSRQAIFRGNTPLLIYQQNPTSEKRLWEEFWTSPSRRDKRMSECELAYQHGSLCLADTSSNRIAMVDVDLDEKMHASSDNKDLYSLTENWASKAVEDILVIHNMGYTIYLTTDHGNILSHGWRSLNSQEKTFLFKDGSRGTRHLIYNNTAYLNDFVAINSDMQDCWMQGGDWLVWKTDQCFKAKDCITHGGSHFLEVIVPFIKINTTNK